MANPCQPVRFREDNGWLVRFYYYRQPHLPGGVPRPVRRGGRPGLFPDAAGGVPAAAGPYQFPAATASWTWTSRPGREEREDAYARYARAGVPGACGGCGKAYSNTGTPEPFYTFNVTMGFVPLDRLREVARSYGASITEYLAAVLIQVHAGQAAPGASPPGAAGGPGGAHQPAGLVSPPRPCATSSSPSVPSSTRRWGTTPFRRLSPRCTTICGCTSTARSCRPPSPGNVRFTQNRLLQLVPVVAEKPGHGPQLQAGWACGPTPAPTPTPAPSRCRRRWRPTSGAWRSCWARPLCPGATAPPSAMATPWRSPLPAPRQETDTERDFFRFLVREGIPCAGWRATA